MTSTRLFIVISALLMTLAIFLAVTYSNELAPISTEQDVELFERMQKLYTVIEENYYTETEIKDLFSGAINGMLHELDPHSGFIDAADYPDMEEQYRGNYQGIGVSFIMIDDKITVMDVVDGGPSDAAGLQMGDRIVEIEDESAIGLTSEQVQEKLRGPGGTKVTVGLERHTHDELIYTTITRGQIPISSVQNTMMLDDKTGYVQITRFARPTSFELEDTLRSLENMGMKQLVLDLRNNGGGLLSTAIAITDKFLKGERLIVYTDGQTEYSYQTFKSHKSGRNWDLPVVILVNHASASASEIVAGALQDWDRAVIVGETTFGKGLVQSSYMLSDMSRLLLTTSHYFTPTGRLIQRPYKGIDLETYQMRGLDGNDSGYFEDEEEVKADKPVYITPSGRTVYGGGGITPDETIDSELLFDPFVYSLANQFVFFMYGREWIQENPLEGIPFDSYFVNFNVTDKMVAGLLAKAQEREFEYYPRRGRKFSEEQIRDKFWELKDQIKLYLKAEIAQFAYDRAKGFAIRTLNNDSVLAKAREKFELATDLAANQDTIDPGFFAAHRGESRSKR